VCFALITFDQHEIRRRQARQHFRDRWLRPLVHDGVAPAAHDRDLTRAGRAVTERVRARLVDVDVMVGMLDGRHAPAAAHELRHQAFRQCRLAGVLPSGDAEDTLTCHSVIRSAWA
jgi:hypothetical protein